MGDLQHCVLSLRHTPSIDLLKVLIQFEYLGETGRDIDSTADENICTIGTKLTLGKEPLEAKDRELKSTL